MIKSHLPRQFAAAGILLGAPLIGLAQDGPNSSIYSGRLAAERIALRRQLEQAPPSWNAPPPPVSGWYETPTPPPREVKVNDIVTIRVDLGARVFSDGNLQRRKSANYDAVLKDWIIMDGLKAIRPDPQSGGDPHIQGTLNQLLRAQANLQTSESIKFEIAATVASVLPNGTLVLEAHRDVRYGEEHWIASLSGTCRREDILANNTIMSKDIAGLKIDKREVGAINSGYKRGWLTRWMDTFNPF
jgi:flagellar L-ring protein precursor FlgH